MPLKRVEIGSLALSSATWSKTSNTAQDEPDTDTTSFSSAKNTGPSMFPSMTDGYIEDSDSNLTEPSSDNEDLKGKEKVKGKEVNTWSVSDEDGDDEEEIEWEDVFQVAIEPTLGTSVPPYSGKTGDLQLTLDNNRAQISTANKKKGASSQERRIRVLTHCLHVQFLLFHGAVRNAWLCDSELHAILLSHLTPNIMRDIEKFQTRQRKGSDKEAVAKGVTDPVLKLLGTLIHWWKKKFIVDKNGLKKNGYKTLSQFQMETEQEGEKFQFTTGNRGQDGEETFTLFQNQGETIRGLGEFRRLAGKCRGSRDTGAILFTALLRAIGLEARMIFSLQPLGFRFTESESSTAARSPEKQRTKETPNKVNNKCNHKSKGKKVAAGDEGSEDGSDYESSASGSIFHEDSQDLPRRDFTESKNQTYDEGLAYPIFWSEVYLPTSDKWITVESIILTVLGSSPDLLTKFEPKGKKAADSKQVIAYVIAYSSDGTAKDVTVRYLAKNSFPGKAKGLRIPITRIPIYSYEGNIVATHKRDWFGGVMRGYRTPDHMRMEKEKQEDDELQRFISKAGEVNREQKESINYYKNSPDYVLERHLKRDEAVKSGKGHVKTFTVGKGDKAKEEKVYSKGDIVVCKTVENWYREGRVIKEGQQPLKMVKPRAATLNRRREIEESKRDGETVTQGLYSEEQTKLYDPPLIVDGRIPRNSFGNIDIYVPSMIPSGAIHLSLKGLAKLARRLGIDYAEAVTGFEFKKQRAVPVIDGIIAAEENEDLLRDAWRAEEEEKRRRADGKRERLALAMWRRFLMGLRIVTRLREEYGNADDDAVDINPFAVKKLHQVNEEQPYGEGEEYEMKEGGGFLRGGTDHETGGEFIRDDGDEASGGGGFLTEEGQAVSNSYGFQVVLDSENETNTPGESGFLISSADSQRQNSVVSLRDMTVQKERISTENTKPNLRQRLTASPEIRSPYFTSDAASNNPQKGKKLATSGSDDELLELPSEKEDLKLRSKTKIEVQVPITRATPSRKTKAPNLDPKSDVRTPNSTTRRVSKRKVAVEAEKKQNKYFMDDWDDPDAMEEGRRRKARKTKGG